MKKKTLIIIGFATIFTLSVTLTSAWAGSPQQYRWEGVAIGVGAAILGSALLYDHAYAPPPVRVVYRHPYPPPRVYYPPPRVIDRRPCPPRHKYYSQPRNHQHWKYRNGGYPNHRRH